MVDVNVGEGRRYGISIHKCTVPSPIRAENLLFLSKMYAILGQNMGYFQANMQWNFKSAVAATMGSCPVCKCLHPLKSISVFPQSHLPKIINHNSEKQLLGWWWGAGKELSMSKQNTQNAICVQEACHHFPSLGSWSDFAPPYSIQFVKCWLHLIIYAIYHCWHNDLWL